MRRAIAIAALSTATGLPSSAGAQPVRLRADALTAAERPAGLLVLDATGEANRSLSAEALVWVGSGDEREAEALVIALKARRVDGRAEGRVGRFVIATGALRPLHLDGAAGRVRLPRRLGLEAFAGAPVASGFDTRTWDWAAGGRASRQLGDWGSAGVAYLQRRDGGRLSAEEIGLDAGGAPADWLDLGSRLAVDLVSVGVAEAQATAAARRGPWRVETYGTYRSPAHLIPATSLFSVLGDLPAVRLGAQARWRAAPRLDLVADGGPVAAGDEWGAHALARALLRLDDRGTGSVSGELRREDAPGDGWTGARATLRTPPVRSVALAVELELARTDEENAGESLWPWGLVALAHRRGDWETAIAVEGSSTPEYRRRIDALARLTWMWGTP